MILPAAQPGLEMSSKVEETKMIVIYTPNVVDQALRLSTVTLHDCKPEAKSRICFQPFDLDERQLEIPGIAGAVTDTPVDTRRQTQDYPKQHEGIARA